ncbi:MAG: cation diffusion facilitator family transporter [Anaerovorax sp.]|nr:cation diffusion facilitator family transporter [Anaerovorax sp.]
MEQSMTQKVVMQVSLISILVNILLSLFKLFAGIFAQSSAMVSDAVHSASDVFSTFIVIIGVKMATKESDKEHPYGHERIECVAAILLAATLGFIGMGIGYSGFMKIISAHEENLIIPGPLALIAAVSSMVIKEGMFWYTRNAAKKIQSGALMADAWHHRSDALSSVGSFAGIFGARLGLPILDPVASIIICLFIIKAAYDIFIDSIEKMMDKACDDAFIEGIKTVITEQEGVLGIDQIKTRLFGEKIYVDIEIQANGNETLNYTHEIAHKIHDAIENDFPRVKHCMVHVNPVCFESEEKEKEERKKVSEEQ